MRCQGNRRGAIVHESKIRGVGTAERDGRDVQRGVSGAAYRQSLSRAGSSFGCGWERWPSRRRKGDSRCKSDSSPAKSESLRAPRCVICNLQIGRERPGARRNKDNADGTVGIGGERRQASIGLRKAVGICSRDRDGAERKQLITRIDYGKDLRSAACACSGSKVGGSGRENDRARTIAQRNKIPRYGQALAATGYSCAEWRSLDFRKIAGLRINRIGVDNSGLRCRRIC
jgi:hypothetical protein